MSDDQAKRGIARVVGAAWVRIGDYSLGGCNTDAQAEAFAASINAAHEEVCPYRQRIAELETHFGERIVELEAESEDHQADLIAARRRVEELEAALLSARRHLSTLWNAIGWDKAAEASANAIDAVLEGER